MIREPVHDRPTHRPRLIRKKRIRYGAILVDFENIYTTLAQKSAKPRPEDPVSNLDALDDSLEVLSNLRERVREQFNCVMAIGRSYADFDRLGGDAQSQLQLLAFEPRFMLGAEEKSSADILLSIDAIEMLLTRPELEMFVIVGGSRGYLPVVRRVREHLKRVVLVGFEKATSGDLRHVVGEENFIAAETLLPDLPPPAEAGNGSAQGTAREEEEGDFRGAPTEPPSNEDLERCMEELLAAYYQYGGRTVWLTPFLRILNEKFPYLDNRGRKRLVEDLQARQAIRIDKVEGDPYPYSVVEINWDNAWVQRMDEARGNS